MPEHVDQLIVGQPELVDDSAVIGHPAAAPYAPVAPLPAHGARQPLHTLNESFLKKAGTKSHMFLKPDSVCATAHTSRGMFYLHVGASPTTSRICASSPTLLLPMRIT